MCVTAAIVSTALSAFGAYQQYESAQDAEDAAKAEARARADEGAMRKADMTQEQQAKEARTRAIAAANQLTMEGSPSTYLKEMQKQGQERLSYLDRVTRSEVKAAKYGGEQAKSRALAGATGTLAGIPGYWT